MGKSALGKGLASLLPGTNSPTSFKIPPGTPDEIEKTATGETTSSKSTPPVAPSAVETSEEEIRSVGAPNKDKHLGISVARPEDIKINPFQPRREFDEKALEELTQSIQENGVIQPLVVRKLGNQFELIAGERRLRASKKAGLETVPIVIRKSTDRESLELALIENIQRQNLNCVDEALAYFQLMEEFSLSQEELAQRMGKDRASVANYLRLLKLPVPLIDDLKAKRLSFGHGKALLSLEDNESRLGARATILEKKLSVRGAEELVSQMKEKARLAKEASGAPIEIKKEKTPVQRRLKALGDELSKSVGTRVEIKGSERRGKIVLHYGSREELERVLQSMQNRT